MSNEFFKEIQNIKKYLDKLEKEFENISGKYKYFNSRYKTLQELKKYLSELEKKYS